MNINLEAAVKRIMVHGPDRVMINADEGVPSSRAREEHHINPDVIFIRDDGWSLGAPKHLEAEAKRLWAGHWLAVIRKPNTTPEPV